MFGILPTASLSAHWSCAAHTTGYCWTVLLFQGIASSLLCWATCTALLLLVLTICRLLRFMTTVRALWPISYRSTTTQTQLLEFPAASGLICLLCLVFVQRSMGCVWAKLTRTHAFDTIFQKMSIFEKELTCPINHALQSVNVHHFGLALTLSLHFVVSLCRPAPPQGPTSLRPINEAWLALSYLSGRWWQLSVRWSVLMRVKRQDRRRARRWGLYQQQPRRRVSRMWAQSNLKR